MTPPATQTRGQRVRSRGPGTRLALGWLALLWLLLAAGCAGSAGPRRELADLPAPPELERYEGAAETTLDGVWVATTLSRAQLPSQRSVDYYWIPRERDYEQVVGFYRQQLASDGWAEDEETDLPNAARWTRPSDAGQQVLVVAEIGIGEEQGTILLRSLTTE